MVYSYNMAACMNRLIIIIILCICISAPCSAMTFFMTDYDGDTYTAETVYSSDWLPLRELSEILPYSVEWKDRAVYIYADRTWEIKPDRWMPKSAPSQAVQLACSPVSTLTISFTSPPVLSTLIKPLQTGQLTQAT